MDKSKFGNISQFNGYGAGRIPMIKKLSPFDLADNINAQDCDFGKFLKTAASTKKTVKRSKATSNRATGRSIVKSRSKSKNTTVRGKVKNKSKSSRAKCTATPRTPKRRYLSTSSEDTSEYEESNNSSSGKRKTVSKPPTSVKRVMEHQPHKATVPCLEGHQQVSSGVRMAEVIPIDPVLAADESMINNHPDSAPKSVKFNTLVQDNDGNSLPCGESGKWKKIRMYQEKARKRELRKKRERARKRSQGKKTSKRGKSTKRPRTSKKSKKRGTRSKSKRRSRSSTRSKSGTRRRSSTKSGSSTRRRRKASRARKGGRRSAK